MNAILWLLTNKSWTRTMPMNHRVSYHLPDQRSNYLWLISSAFNRTPSDSLWFHLVFSLISLGFRSDFNLIFTLDSTLIFTLIFTFALIIFHRFVVAHELSHEPLHGMLPKLSMNFMKCPWIPVSGMLGLSLFLRRNRVPILWKFPSEHALCVNWLSDWVASRPGAR